MASERLPPTGDPVLDRIAAETPVPLLEPSGAVFHDLMSCLVEQQIHVRSTKGTFRRALARAGLERLTPEQMDRFERDGLAGVRLSAVKRQALAHATDAFRDGLAGTDWAAMDDAAVRAALGAIRGVGPWTVDMVLLYTLGRPDVFPERDYHLRLAMAAAYGLDARAQTPAALRRRAEPWRPHRSRAVRALLAWKDLRAERLREIPPSP